MSLERNKAKKCLYVLQIAHSTEIKHTLTCSKATGLQPTAAAWVKFQEDEEKLVTVKTEKDDSFHFVKRTKELWFLGLEKLEHSTASLSAWGQMSRTGYLQ